MNYFNYNGKIYKDGTSIVGPDNRGLRYGDGIFETMKMKAGKLIGEDEHFARLWKGMQLLQFDIPKNLTPEKFKDEISTLSNKNGLVNAARIRLSIIRGDGGLYDPKNHFPNHIIQTFPLSEENEKWNSNGFISGVYESCKKSLDILSNLKHNNYLPYLLAALHAKKEKWNDAILLNSNGGICDTTIANIFLVKENIVYTPALSEGCVAGIMRKMVIRLLATGIGKLVEKELGVQDLCNADEVFLTNSIYNIRWVQQIGDKKYNCTVGHKIYTALMPTIL